MLAHNFTYTPHIEPPEPPRPPRFGNLCPDCRKGKDQFVANVRRWWNVTTDRDFLTSSASRRNAWKVLLPLAGLLAMLADCGFGNLMILDGYATVALLMVAYLPPGVLWSDLAVALVHVVFCSAHGVLVARERRMLSEDDLDSDSAEPWTCQVLSVFAMASAGVHSIALLSFTGTVAAFSHFLRTEAGLQQIVACLYVVSVACFAERRLAQLVFDVQGSDFGYKALMPASDQESVPPDSPRHSTEPLMSSPTDTQLPVAAAETSTPAVVHPDGEDDQESLQSLQTMHHSTESHTCLTELVLSHLKPKETSRRFSRAEEMFSRLQPVFSRPRPRFAAAQVQPPAAATHDAPVFVEKIEIPKSPPGLHGLHEATYSVYSQSAPSTARSESPVARIPSIVTESDQPQRNASPTRQAPVSPTASTVEAGQESVLRGLKMQGFQTAQLNVLFIESKEESWKVNGRETYWSEAKDYFLYYSKATDTWGLGKGKRFQAIIDGASNGVAHSPEKYEIWDTGRDSAHGSRKRAASRGNWREWDTKAGKWVSRPNSGVANRGKVRPKVGGPESKAVQTEWSCKDQECQTDP